MIEIYIIRCRVNAKVYVGQTKCGIKQRWSQHVATSRYDYRRQYSAIARAIYKHGPESFTISVLMSGIKTIEEANESEIRMIAQCRSRDPRFGYNVHPGGSYTHKAGDGNKWKELGLHRERFAPESMTSFPDHLKIKIPDGAHPEHCLMRAGKISNQIGIRVPTLKRWCEDGLIEGVISGRNGIWLRALSVQRFIDSRKKVRPKEAA